MALTSDDNASFRAIIENAPTAMLVGNVEDAILCRSKQVAKFFRGKKIKSMGDIFTPEELARVKGNLEGVADGNAQPMFFLKEVDIEGQKYPWVIAVTSVTPREYIVLFQSQQEAAKGSNFFDIDPLTNITNRRHANQLLSLEWARYSRGEGLFAIAMADIDHFKSINDEFGHRIGDNVLIHVANILKRSLRAEDWCARWGGEEFLVFFADLKPEDSFSVVERIRAELEGTPYPGPPQVPTTSSFGLVSSIGFRRLEDMLEHADIMLYKAKQSGRNMVQFEASRVHISATEEGLKEHIAQHRIRGLFGDVVDWDGGREFLHATPVVSEDTASNVFLSGEALLSVAQRYGLVVDVEKAFLLRVIEAAGSGRVKQIGDLPITVPVSMSTLGNRRALAEICEAASRLPKNAAGNNNIVFCIQMHPEIEPEKETLDQLSQAGFLLGICNAEMEKLPFSLLFSHEFYVVMIRRWKRALHDTTRKDWLYWMMREVTVTRGFYLQQGAPKNDAEQKLLASSYIKGCIKSDDPVLLNGGVG